MEGIVGSVAIDSGWIVRLEASRGFDGFAHGVTF